MKIKIIFGAVFLLFFSSAVSADIGLENKTELLLGVRMQNQGRSENYVLVKPGQSVSVKNTQGGLSLSAQLITGSYEINCCEWFSVPDAKKLVVRLTGGGSCRCELR
ncbi:MAG: hypothetical protein LRY50_10470 [Geovibrio sp.]|nr:hypothetical protein [Geovibrio sp.]